MYLFLGSQGSGRVLGSDDALPAGESADEADEEREGEPGALKYAGGGEPGAGWKAESSPKMLLRLSSSAMM